MQRLFVDLKENHRKELTGTIKLPHDGAFTLEALLTVIEEFANTVGRKPSEVLADLYGHQIGRERNEAR